MLVQVQSRAPRIHGLAVFFSAVTLSRLCYNELMKRLISVVVPIFNEESGIRKFLDDELMPALDIIDEDKEIILVDDGSSDKSVSVAKTAEINEKYTVKIISFTRNFGKEIALTAGIRNANGDAVIMIDADGQHPASEIPKMVEKWRDGAKIVTAIRNQNTTKHRLGSKLYYSIMRMAGNRNVREGEMDFRLIDRVVVDEFNKLAEHNRLTRGLINWLGFPQTYIKVQTKDRTSGEPSYSFRKLMTLAGDSIVSTSRTPLLIFGNIGVFIMLLSGGTGLFQLIQEYILHDPMHLEWGGGVAVSMFVAFLVGIVLVSQSITAIYISQIHAEVKGRPLYVVDKSKSSGINNAK